MKKCTPKLKGRAFFGEEFGMNLRKTTPFIKSFFNEPNWLIEKDI